MGGFTGVDGGRAAFTGGVTGSWDRLPASDSSLKVARVPSKGCRRQCRSHSRLLGVDFQVNPGRDVRASSSKQIALHRADSGELREEGQKLADLAGASFRLGRGRRRTRFAGEAQQRLDAVGCFISGATMAADVGMRSTAGSAADGLAPCAGTSLAELGASVAG